MNTKVEGTWEDGGVGGSWAHPAPCLQLDNIHIQVNKPLSNLKTGRKNSATKYREETASERSAGSERWRETAQEGGSCTQGEGRERSPHTRELTQGRLIPVSWALKTREAEFPLFTTSGTWSLEPEKSADSSKFNCKEKTVFGGKVEQSLSYF